MLEKIKQLRDETLQDWQTITSYIHTSETYYQSLTSETEKQKEDSYKMQLICEANTLFKIYQKLNEIIKGEEVKQNEKY